MWEALLATYSFDSSLASYITAGKMGGVGRGPELKDFLLVCVWCSHNLWNFIFLCALCWYGG